MMRQDTAKYLGITKKHFADQMYTAQEFMLSM